MVKTHYPTISSGWDPSVIVTKVIHLVRNPFDNMASRYLGNHKKNAAQFAELVEARKRGETTAHFDKMLKKRVQEYAEFHQYWIKQRVADAERGVATLFIRYEGLCSRTREVLEAIARFGGFRLTPVSFDCTLEIFSCQFSPAAAEHGMPRHGDLFNAEQVDYVLNATAPVLDAYVPTQSVLCLGQLTVWCPPDSSSLPYARKRERLHNGPRTCGIAAGIFLVQAPGKLWPALWTLHG